MDLTFSPARFIDTDQFLNWERGLGWDVEITQLSTGANEIGFDHCIFPGLLVGHFDARQAIQGRFALPSGMVLFVLFRKPQPLRWNGAELPPNLMGIVHPGRTHWVIQQPEWDCYEFMVSEELVRRTEIFPPSFFDQTTDADRPILPLQPTVTRRFVRGLDRMFREIASPHGHDSFLLEVPEDDPAFVVAYRLLRFSEHFVPMFDESIPETSLIREFIGGSFFDY